MSLSHLKEVSELMGEVAELKDKLSRYEDGVRVEGTKVLRKWVRDAYVGTVCMGLDVPKEWIGQQVTVLLLKEDV